MNADIRAGMLPPQFCARSNLFRHAAFRELRQDVQSVMECYPLDVRSPFEGVSTIFGGIWNGSKLCDSRATDALLKLRFQAGTTDLPIHSHDHSDRVIFVARGAGIFEFASDGQSPQQMGSIEVGPGDTLIFPRGTVYTFKVPAEDLWLLSYHSPFIALDDSRQFTIARETIEEIFRESRPTR